MQRTTHICIACRQVARASGLAACPICRNPMKDMGMRWEAPKKRDDVAWAKLELMALVRDSLVRLCTCYDCTSWRNAPGSKANLAEYKRPRASLAEYKRWLRRRREHHLWDIPQSRTRKYITIRSS